MTGVNWSLVGQFAIALGLGGVIVAVIQNFLSPKTRAEARQIAASVAQKTVDQALAALEQRAVAAEARAEKLEQRATAAEVRADEADVKSDEAVAQVRRMTDVLWQCASYLRRVEASLTPEQQQRIGPSPNLDQFFK